MALECTLTCTMNATRERIRDVIVVHCGAQNLSQGDTIQFRLPGVVCTLLEASKLLQELTWEKYQFVPTHEFFFRLDKSSQSAFPNTLEMCIAIIVELAIDCVLCTIDQPILLRRAGQLTFQGCKDARNRAYLQQLTTLANGIGEPYRIAEFTNTLNPQRSQSLA